jgi:hypothetical protein
MSSRRLATLCTVSLVCSAAALPLSARADTDACTVLTPAQVAAVVGVAVSAGNHVTPTFVRTCTWNATDSNSPVKFVTLYLQTVAAYDGGKRMASQMAAAAKGTAVQSAAVGDDAYYFVAADQAGLLVKKGNSSFKVTVYAKLPVDKKEAMELALAKEALAKL